MKEDRGHGRGGGVGHVGDGRAEIEFLAAIARGVGVILDDVVHRDAAAAVMVQIAALGEGEEQAVEFVGGGAGLDIVEDGGGCRGVSTSGGD